VVPAGWSDTVTPYFPGYVFDPMERVYSDVTTSLEGQDYMAAASHVISGTVRLGESGLSGVMMLGLPGGTTAATGPGDLHRNSSGWLFGDRNADARGLHVCAGDADLFRCHGGSCGPGLRCDGGSPDSGKG